jgi:glutathione S-transferase
MEAYSDATTMRQEARMRLYDYLDSGNGYKVRLLLTQLGVPFERIEVDIMQGQSRTQTFLQKNLNGRIPVLETDEGNYLPESNAILFYLSEGTPFLPPGRFERAQVLQWMFFEQYSHEPNIATVRHWLKHTGLDDQRRAVLEQKRALGYAALEVMERHLADRAFFVGDRYSIADIALYAYTHVADEGGFDLGRFAGVNAWLQRVKSQPGHIPITKG